MKATKRITALIMAVACLLAMSACSKGNGGQSGSHTVKEIKSYGDIYDIISSMRAENSYTGEIATDDMMTDGSFEVEDSAESSTTPGYSGTNVQVNGVDEGDIIKTDGKYIYMLRYGHITIVEAETLKELSSIEIEDREYAGINQMYLYGDKLAVLANIDLWSKHYAETGEYSDKYGSETAVIIYDVTDRSAPKHENTLSQDGYFMASRMVDGVLYTVSSYYTYDNKIEEGNPETFIPAVSVDGAKALIKCEDICVFPEINSAAYNIITSVDLNDCAQYANTKAAFGGNGTVYADTDSLVLAVNSGKYEETEGEENGKSYVKTESRNETSILLYSMEKGKIEEKASGVIPGSLLNQFSIDEYNGYYRFVTTDNRWTTTIYTDGIDQYESDSSESNGLYVLDGSLNVVGKIENLAKDERVQSVRFDGDIAYFVTFRQVDPLFTVDLSSPENPKIMSELKIPGFSSYLHKFGEGRLLGLGYDADEETGWTKGLKLSMFDISNPYDVTEKHKLILDEEYSEAIYNHKAILVSEDKNLITFPVINGYLVYGYDDESGFFLKNKVKLNKDYYGGEHRGLYIGERFFVCGSDRIIAFDIASFEELKTLELSILQ